MSTDSPCCAPGAGRPAYAVASHLIPAGSAVASRCATLTLGDGRA
jgi:hypothetical protein